MYAVFIQAYAQENHGFIYLCTCMNVTMYMCIYVFYILMENKIL